MSDLKPGAIDWAKASGDIWAQRWRHTDRGLEPLQPRLVAAVADRAPSGPFRAFDIGCGPGSTAIAVASARADASIVACDISASLAEVARQRTADRSAIRVVVGDAEASRAAKVPSTSSSRGTESCSSPIPSGLSACFARQPRPAPL